MRPGIKSYFATGIGKKNLSKRSADRGRPNTWGTDKMHNKFIGKEWKGYREDRSVPRCQIKFREGETDIEVCEGIHLWYVKRILSGYEENA